MQTAIRGWRQLQQHLSCHSSRINMYSDDTNAFHKGLELWIIPIIADLWQREALSPKHFINHSLLEVCTMKNGYDRAQKQPDSQLVHPLDAAET